MKDVTYTIQTDTDSTDQAMKVSVSLYPDQLRVVRLYAAQSRRSFSNALQFIVDDWARQQAPTPEAA